ncbi:hypothetical protein BGZ94_007905 [Podila epigama]|nr:hypothetical protein BGZ94_007905 [Podila epigama]
MFADHHKYTSVPHSNSIDDLQEVALNSPRSESSSTLNEEDKEKERLLDDNASDSEDSDAADDLLEDELEQLQIMQRARRERACNSGLLIKIGCNLLGFLAVAIFGAICMHLCNYSQEDALYSLNRWASGVVGAPPSFTMTEESRHQLFEELGLAEKEGHEMLQQQLQQHKHVCEATTPTDLVPGTVPDMELDAHEITIESLGKDVQLSVRVLTQDSIQKPTLRVLEGKTNGAMTGLYLRNSYQRKATLFEVVQVNHKMGSMEEEIERCIQETPRERWNGRKILKKKQQKRHHHHNHRHHHDQDEKAKSDVSPANLCQVLRLESRSTSDTVLPERHQCSHLTIELMLPKQKELCLLKLEGSVMQVTMDNVDAVFKKLEITNEYGSIRVNNVKANKLELQSALSSIAATGVRSGHGKKLEILAVSPTGDVLIQIADEPTSMLELEAISGKANVDAVLPSAYRGQVLLKGEKKGELNQSFHGKATPKGKCLRNKVRLESFGEGSHARLFYV